MKSLRLRLLLVLAFIAAQSFAVAHATQHDLLQQDSVGCSICLVANAAPVPPAPLVLPVLNVSVSATLPVPLVEILDRAPFDRPNSRGPPNTLV